MSIAILNDVYNETRRLAIAGSGLAKGDFRLKKLVAPLEKAGERAPVFSRVASAIETVVESKDKSAAPALLELSTLVTAILYTQGKTGFAGTLNDIETSGVVMPTINSSARVLKPLIEALTTTGSGRLEIITDAHKRGAFKDLRLVKPALHAIDDSYAEISDFVSLNVVPMYGRAILPELRESIDLKGRSGHVRRLKLMHEIDPEGTRELVTEALEVGSKEIKVAAIGCLSGSASHLSYIVEQAKSRLKDVRAAALNVLSTFTESEAVDTLQKAMSGADIAVAAAAVSRNRSPQILEFLLQECDAQLEELLASKSKDKTKKGVARFLHLLEGLTSRDDQQTEAFLLRCFQEREAIDRLKGGTFNGDAITDRVARLIVGAKSKAARNTLIDAHESLSANTLQYAFIAAALTRTPKQVFKLFSAYFTAEVTKKRGRDPIAEKKDGIRNALLQITGDYADYYFHRMELHDADGYDLTSIKLDAGWLNAAISTNDMGLVKELATPRHKAAIAYLSKAIDKQLGKSRVGYEVAEIIGTMIRIKHPRATDCVVQMLEVLSKQTSRHGHSWWVVRLIPDLPKAAVKTIEKLLPTLNEKLIDEVIPFVEALKSK